MRPRTWGPSIMPQTTASGGSVQFLSSRYTLICRRLTREMEVVSYELREQAVDYEEDAEQ